MGGSEREERLVEIGMEVVRGILDEHEGKPNREAIRRRSDALVAHRLTGWPAMDYETELLQAAEHDVPALCDALEAESRRASALEGELEGAKKAVLKAESACKLANDAFNSLLLQPTNEVPAGFFAAWSRHSDGEGIGHTAHKAVHGVVLDASSEAQRSSGEAGESTGGSP